MPRAETTAPTDIPSGETSRRVAAYLRDAILRGEIRPGERIRQEDVAGRFGSSRLPVREALRMLEAEGLCVHAPNKGARVPLLDRREVEVIYQMRERLEPLALIESLPHLSEEDFLRLQEIQERIEASDDMGEFLVLDREFHLLTYRGCQIEQLSSMVTRLWNTTQHYRRAFMMLTGPSRRWVVNAEHRLLLDALQQRDAVDAERHLVGHIRRTRIEFSRHPEAFKPTDR
jgi:DNA-binding GntR family transcriptional regulator